MSRGKMKGVVFVIYVVIKYAVSLCGRLQYDDKIVDVLLLFVGVLWRVR